MWGLLVMSRVYIEQRELPNMRMSTVAADLTQHFFTRMSKGKLVVVAEEPFLLLRMARKHWLQLERYVQRERARTLHAGRIAELSSILLRLQQLEFAAKPPSAAPLATILFLSPDEVSEITSECHTVYMVCEVSQEVTDTAQAKMQQNGLIVTYKTK